MTYYKAIPSKLFAISLLLISCASKKGGIDDPEKRNEHWAWVEDPKTGEGKWIELGGDQAPPNGKYTLFFSNGKIRQKGMHKDGQSVDSVYHYDLNEKLTLKGFYENDSLVKRYYMQQPCSLFYPTCELQAVIENNGIKPNGSETIFYKNGKKRAEGTFKNGLKNGRFLSWHENGKRAMEMFVIDNRADSIKKIYYESGKLKEETHYNNDTLDGQQRSWHENGNLKMESYYVKGILNGKSAEWYENGNQKVLGFIKNGEPDGQAFFWYENGAKEMEIFLVNGKKNGPFKSWYENGRIHQVGTLKDDEPTEDFKEWDEEGKPLTK